MDNIAFTDDEERILRVWTPIILRTILVSAMAILVVGLLSVVPRLAPDRIGLERSALRRYSAHYQACLVKNRGAKT